MKSYHITRTFTFRGKDNGTSIICQSKCEDDPTNVQTSIIRLIQIVDPGKYSYFCKAIKSINCLSNTTHRYLNYQCETAFVCYDLTIQSIIITYGMAYIFSFLEYREGNRAPFISENCALPQKPLL